MRHAFASISPESNTKYIYISRGTSTRRVLNERHLVDKLCEIAPFVLIDLESLSLPEIISLFKAAKVVIGSYSEYSVLSVFMDEGSSLIEFFGPYCQGEEFKNLAYQSKINYYCNNISTSSAAIGAGNCDQNFFVDIVDICELVRDAMGNMIQ
jgi:capsular polysaccharide biosynthesis protein